MMQCTDIVRIWMYIYNHSVIAKLKNPRDSRASLLGWEVLPHTRGKSRFNVCSSLKCACSSVSGAFNL